MSSVCDFSRYGLLAKIPALSLRKFEKEGSHFCSLKPNSIVAQMFDIRSIFKPIYLSLTVFLLSHETVFYGLFTSLVSCIRGI